MFQKEKRERLIYSNSAILHCFSFTFNLYFDKVSRLSRCFSHFFRAFNKTKRRRGFFILLFFPIWRVLISVFIICFLRQILRKKYYNMIEDMKGKIRVYCRARPLSRSELERVRLKVFSLLALRCYPICRGTSSSQLKAVY